MSTINSESIQNISEKVRSGVRITSDEAVIIYNNLDLASLGSLANSVRQSINPGNKVSYLIDRNINYTNVCNSDCTFCGFYRPSSSHDEAYVQSKDELAERINEAVELGATRILLQGGHNDDLKLDYYLDLISWINDNFEIEINSFSPSEIHQMHLISGLDYREILTQLKACGMKGLPGGGAEMLDDKVRKRVSPKKVNSDIWIKVMEVAHSLDLTTTSTMIIGFGEDVESRILHLEKLRNLQDLSQKNGHKGFNAFISWTLQLNENTSMGRSRHREKYGASSIEYLRNLAVSRIFLDNIPHHAASWPTLGVEIAKVGLHFGCDDFGSTMMEENVVSKAGALTQSKWSMSPIEIEKEIASSGFTPVRRNSSYEYFEN